MCPRISLSLSLSLFREHARARVRNHHFSSRAPPQRETTRDLAAKLRFSQFERERETLVLSPAFQRPGSPEYAPLSKTPLAAPIGTQVFVGTLSCANARTAWRRKEGYSSAANERTARRSRESRRTRISTLGVAFFSRVCRESPPPPKKKKERRRRVKAAGRMCLRG